MEGSKLFIKVKMNKKILKRISYLKIKFFILIFAILIPSFVVKRYAYSNESINNDTLIDYIYKNNENNYYLLGPGDTFKLSVSENAEDLEGIYTIDGEGMVDLKRINRIYISGLSLYELNQILYKEYSKYIYEPDIEIKMIKYKNLEVYIDGEVSSPGLYVLKGSKTYENDNDNDDSVFGFPKLSDVLRKAEGVTINADLGNIYIKRKYPISLGGGKVATKINFLEVLNLNDMNQNIRVSDGDIIVVPKSDEIVISQISKAIKSNINPKFQNVYVLGRVNNPGLIKVSKSAALSDALSVAGGLRVLRGEIKFIRNKNDGTIDERKISFKRKNKRGSKNNPYLRDGDVIIIGDSFFSKSSEVVTEFTSPFNGLLNTLSIYKILSDY